MGKRETQGIHQEYPSDHPDRSASLLRKERPFLDRLQRDFKVMPLHHRILTMVAVPAGIASLTALVVGLPLAVILDSQELRNVSVTTVVTGFAIAAACEIIARHSPQSRS